ncbi:MAG: DnaD domain protein [Oscillospiraceae bacterium]|nr:DnaD domain protein [Oscillospiraceae bacterium]
MEIYLNNGHSFPVPVAVADHLLGLASHDQLKVLLYVLCHANEPLSQEQIAKCCKVQPAAVEEALVFWQDANVLLNAQPVPAAAVQNTAAAVQTEPVLSQQPAPDVKPAAEAETVIPRIQSTSSSFALRPSEIAERFQQNRALAEMYRAAEQIAGKPLTHTEQKSLIWMHEYLGLEPDLILMLAAFCVQENCFHVRYMEQVAVEWQERGVMTHALVEEDIRRRTEARSYTGRIMKLFEMSRRPTTKQQEFIDSWQKSGFSPELVQLACEITRDKKDDKIRFDYLNGILRRWEKAGIRTPEAARQADLAFYDNKKQTQAAGNPAGQSGNGSSIDMDEVERLMNPL